MHDGIKSLENATNFTLYFYSLVSGVQVQFPGILTKFDDGFKSNWNSQELYGRQDPIPIFKNTIRTISFAWTVQADSQYNAWKNLNRISALIRMLYPSYRDNIINTPPLMRIKLANLITRMTDGKDAQSDGLLGYVDGFNFSPDFNKLQLWSNPINVKQRVSAAPAQLKLQADQFYPLEVGMSCTFHVLHEHVQGIDDKAEDTVRRNIFPGKKLSTRAFPYRATSAPANEGGINPGEGRSVIQEEQARINATVAADVAIAQQKSILNAANKGAFNK